MAALVDLTGKRFGRLLVVERAPTPAAASGRGARWLCRCECGGSTIVASHNLRAGRQVSCGCYQREVAAERATALARGPK